MEMQNKFDQLADELRQDRDELRVKIHLGKMEAKDEWDAAEEKWEKFEHELRLHASRSKKTAAELKGVAAELGDEIAKAYRKIREIL